MIAWALAVNLNRIRRNRNDLSDVRFSNNERLVIGISSRFYFLKSLHATGIVTLSVHNIHSDFFYDSMMKFRQLCVSFFYDDFMSSALVARAIIVYSWMFPVVNIHFAWRVCQFYSSKMYQLHFVLIDSSENGFPLDLWHFINSVRAR